MENISSLSPFGTTNINRDNEKDSSKKREVDQAQDLSVNKRLCLLSKTSFPQSSFVMLDLHQSQQVPPFHAVLHHKHCESLFPGSANNNLYIRIHSQVYKVLWCQESSMQDQVWVDSETCRYENKISTIVTAFDSNQIEKPVNFLELKLKFNSEIKPLARPYPVSIPMIEALCRQALNGIFFNAETQRFEISYRNHSIQVEVQSMLGHTVSLKGVQKIEPETTIAMMCSKEDGFIGGFHTYSAKGKVFTFEILKFINPNNEEMRAGGYFIKDWVRQELRRVLPHVELMRNTVLKIYIKAPLVNYVQSMMSAELSLASVTKKETADSEHYDSLYQFDNEDYQIDFVTPNKQIEIVEKIIEISQPVTVKILDWKDDKSLSKGGITQFSTQDILSELGGSVDYFSLKKAWIETGIGSFFVEFSIVGEHRQDVIYQVKNKTQITLKSEAKNLIIQEKLIENSDKLWEFYIKEQLRIKSLGGLSSQVVEDLIRFIQTLRTSFGPNVQDPKLRPSPVLLISGPPRSGKKFLASFIREMFSPSLTMLGDSSGKLVILSASEISQLTQVSPQKRGIMLINDLENFFTNQSDLHTVIRNFTNERIQFAKQKPGLVLIAMTSDVNKIPKEILHEFGVNHLKIAIPSDEERLEFLKLLNQEGLPFKDVNFDALNGQLKGFPRKGIYDVVRLAKESAIAASKKELTKQDFEMAIQKLEYVKTSQGGLGYFL